MPTLYNICHKVAKVETEPVGGFNRQILKRFYHEIFY